MIAYTSTVVARSQLALAVVLGAAVALLPLLGGPAWPPIAGGVVVALLGLYLSVVRLAVSPDRVAFALGPFGRPRVVRRADVRSAEATSITWPQVWGIGIRTTIRTTRLTVRPGPALCLVLTDGEIVRISTPDPLTAAGVLAADTRTPTRSKENT